VDAAFRRWHIKRRAKSSGRPPDICGPKTKLRRNVDCSKDPCLPTLQFSVEDVQQCVGGCSIKFDSRNDMQDLLRLCLRYTNLSELESETQIVMDIYSNYQKATRGPISYKGRAAITGKVRDSFSLNNTTFHSQTVILYHQSILPFSKSSV
jgi:hypothetical protein